MHAKTCPYCRRRFLPSRYHPNQQICSSKDCQRQRRLDYHRRKLAEDPQYHEQCKDSQRKWRAKHPQYMRDYRGLRSPRAEDDFGIAEQLRGLLKLVKNNVAIDLRTFNASMWLVLPPGLAHVSNTLARTKVILLEGLPPTNATSDKLKRTSL